MRSHRPFALAAAASVVGLALILDLTPAGAARAGDVTYQQLNTALDVQDNDLIATWRASGPLTRVNASVLATYMQGKLGGSFLQTSNALSELTASATLVRSNLGLGTAATQAIGTSGANVCLMNANCTWSGTEIFQAAVTFGLTSTFTGFATFNGGLSGALTGNASTASQWQTTRTETCGGDMTGGTVSVNGAGNWTLPCTIAAGTVTAAKMAAGAATGNLGFTPMNRASNLSDVGSITSSLANLGFVSSGTALFGSVVIPTSSGNVIINWGVETNIAPGGLSAVETFTTQYSSGNIGLCAGEGGGTGSAAFVSTTQIQCKNNSSGTQNVSWIAIGK